MGIKSIASRGKKWFVKSSKAQKEALDRQVTFYHLLVETYRDGAFTINNATLDFIEKNKKGFLEQKSYQIGDKEVDELRELINQVAKEVLSGDFLKKGCGKKDCEYCVLKDSVEI